MLTITPGSLTLAQMRELSAIHIPIQIPDFNFVIPAKAGTPTAHSFRTPAISKQILAK